MGHLCLRFTPSAQAVTALKKRIDAASADFGCNIAVRAVEWHSRMHRMRGWEREVARVSLPSIPELRQGIKDVLGDCFLLLSQRWHDILLAEVRFLSMSVPQIYSHCAHSGCVASQRGIRLVCFPVSFFFRQYQHRRPLSWMLHRVGLAFHDFPPISVELAVAAQF
jgi:hypothetical protein